MEKKLEVKNLKISFRTQAGILQAVRNVSFDLYKGETLAIVGESGSGKSVTNRAIMGILATNGMVEGGQIFYDGQDLVRISEEDFHKLRGDKIAMIFQDPMSSLNPIMRIGKQLTEAMLLKNSASRRNAKHLFNEKLSLLNKNMDELSANDASQIAQNKQDCKTFDNFCINSTKLNASYDTIHNEAMELKVDVDDLLFLIEKKQNINGKKELNNFIKRIDKTISPWVVVDDEKIQTIKANLQKDVAGIVKNVLPENTVNDLKDLSNILEEAINKIEPDFFSLGYYTMQQPDKKIEDISVEELNKLAYDYLNEGFMDSFVVKGAKAIAYSHKASMDKKQQLKEEINSAIEYFKQEDIDEKKANELVNSLTQKVNDAIDRLEVVKNSTEYTFATSFKTVVNSYFEGLKHNVAEEKRFEKQTAKHDKLVAKGKNVDWKVAPKVIFDKELGKENIRSILENLLNSYNKDLENEPAFSSKDKMEELVAYFKEQAKALVHKITKKTAKARALKLLEEVGIPEPTIRYNQYPFEFSGGMRQRIVIAIALAADPDILICDEPTTALDVTIQAQILELINKLKKERNLSVIFITHNLGVVANMADRIAVMYAGKIVEEGTADEIFYDPRHPYTWALLSSMPDLDTKDKLEAIPGTPPNLIYPPVGDAFAPRNKYALKIDFEMQPPMFEITKTHHAATWLLHPNAPKIEPPKIVTDRIERMKKRGAELNG